MKPFRRHVLIQFVAAFCMSGLAGMAATQAPKLISAVQPEHPPALYERGIGGFAKVVISIQADGSISEVTVAEASNSELAEAAVAAAKQWKFEPAMRDGQPVAIKVAQRFEFPPSVQRTLTFLAGRELFIPEPENVVDAEELSNPPSVTTPPAQPHYPARLAGSGQIAQVPIEFLINPAGEPVNLQVALDEDDEQPVLDFQLSALRALLPARWTPPISGGQPVFVRSKITITVEEGPEVPEAPAMNPSARRPQSAR